MSALKCPHQYFLPTYLPTHPHTNPEKLAKYGTEDEKTNKQTNKKTKQKHNTICVGHDYVQIHIHYVNKTGRV